MTAGSAGAVGRHKSAIRPAGFSFDPGEGRARTQQVGSNPTRPIGLGEEGFMVEEASLPSYYSTC